MRRPYSFPFLSVPALLLICCLFLPAGAGAAERMSMARSVDAAIAYNPDLKASQERRQMSQHAIDQARSGYFPSGQAYAGGGVSRLSTPITRSYGEQRDFRAIGDAGLRLTQSLWQGGRTMAEVSARRAEFDSTDNLLEDRGLAVAFDAIVAHTEVLRRRELVKLAENNVREHNVFLNTVRERYNNQVSTIGELNQVESRLARAKATLSSYQSALEAAVAAYLRVTGKNPGQLQESPAPKTVFPNTETVRERCLDSNPRLKAAVADVRVAQGEKDMVKSNFYPRVDLSAGPSWNDRDTRADSRNTSFDAEVRMTWDFLSGGRDMATVSMASAKIRQARQLLHALMDSLNEDIEATYSRYLSSAVQMREYAASKKSSRLAREDYYRQFVSAQRNLIDVLDAENDYFYAASQEVLCKGDRIIAAYRLLALSGALLGELHIDPSRLRVNTPTTTEDSGGMMRRTLPSTLSHSN